MNINPIKIKISIISQQYLSPLLILLINSLSLSFCELTDFCVLSTCLFNSLTLFPVLLIPVPAVFASFFNLPTPLWISSNLLSWVLIRLFHSPILFSSSSYISRLFISFWNELFVVRNCSNVWIWFSFWLYSSWSYSSSSSDFDFKIFIFFLMF